MSDETMSLEEEYRRAVIKISRLMPERARLGPERL